MCLYILCTYFLHWDTNLFIVIIIYLVYIFLLINSFLMNTTYLCLRLVFYHFCVYYGLCLKWVYIIEQCIYLYIKILTFQCFQIPICVFQYVCVMEVIVNIEFISHRRHNMPEWHVPLSRGQVHTGAVGVQLPARLREGRGRVPVVPWVHTLYYWHRINLWD